jgi:hypothetical protein
MREHSLLSMTLQKKTVPKGAMDQIGECLSRVINAFAKAEDDAQIFMAKLDIKDGFWRMDCCEGDEWNFAYVLPQQEGKPITLVVPISLQMGWVESTPYFCMATETAQDVTTKNIELLIGTLPSHIEHYMPNTINSWLTSKSRTQLCCISWRFMSMTSCVWSSPSITEAATSHCNSGNDGHTRCIPHG